MRRISSFDQELQLVREAICFGHTLPAAGVMSFLLRAYSKASKALPYSVAFATCFVKGEIVTRQPQFIIHKKL